MARSTSLALALLVVAGCGPRSATVAKPQPPPVDPTPVVERSVGLKGVELEARNEKGESVWAVKGDTGTLDMYSGQKMVGHLTKVRGTIGGDANVEGDKAVGDQNTKELKIEGNVRLSDSLGVIKGDQLQWRPGRSVIELKGMVAVDGWGVEARGLSTIWTTPDLKLIGTPSAISKTAPASKAADITYNTPDNSVKIRGLNKWKVKRISETELDVSGSGNEVIVVLQTQGVEVTTQSFTARLKKISQKWELINGECLGGTTLVRGSDRFSTASTVNLAKQGGGFEISIPGAATFENAELTAKGSRLSGVLDGDHFVGRIISGVTVQNGRDVAKAQRAEIKSSKNSREIQLSGKARYEGTDGKAHYSFEAHRVTSFEEGPGSLQVKASGETSFSYRVSETRITGSATQVSYDKSKNLIVLTGSVKVKGNNEALSGSMDADKVTIRLNDQGEVVEVEAEAEQGTSRIRGA